MTSNDQMEVPDVPRTLMERTAALESKVATLEKALKRAFGDRWMQQSIIKDEDEPTGE